MTTKNAIASLYSGTDRGYFHGALTLRQSIADNTPDDLDTILLVENDRLSNDELARLASAGWTLRMVPRIKSQPCKYNAARWVHTFSKLHVFGLAEYEKVFYLDADCLVMREIADVFNTELDGKLGACWVNSKIPQLFSAGVLLLEPNQDLFDDLHHKITTLPAEETGAAGSDQQFLNIYFGEYKQIADTYNQRHWGRPKPGVRVAHIRPQPWRAKRPLDVYQKPYYDEWHRIHARATAP